MLLYECEKKPCKIINVDISDEKLKTRLYEIGFFVGAKIKILNISTLKQTLLVAVLDSCFAIKSDVAKHIEVEYD